MADPLAQPLLSLRATVLMAIYAQREKDATRILRDGSDTRRFSHDCGRHFHPGRQDVTMPALTAVSVGKRSNTSFVNQPI